MHTTHPHQASTLTFLTMMNLGSTIESPTPLMLKIEEKNSLNTSMKDATTTSPMSALFFLETISDTWMQCKTTKTWMPWSNGWTRTTAINSTCFTPLQANTLMLWLPLTMPRSLPNMMTCSHMPITQMLTGQVTFHQERMTKSTSEEPLTTMTPPLNSMLKESWTRISQMIPSMKWLVPDTPCSMSLESTNITMLSQEPESKLLQTTMHTSFMWVWTQTVMLTAMPSREKFKLNSESSIKPNGANASKPTLLTLIAQSPTTLKSQWMSLFKILPL